jgi:transcriptional regulator with XRE-family HTH domain
MPRRKVDWYGPRLRELREQAGLSQAELGQRVELAGSQINKLETNVNQPTLATALALADALTVPITDFLPRSDRRGRPRGGPPKVPAAASSTPPAEDLEAERKALTRKRKGK